MGDETVVGVTVILGYARVSTTGQVLMGIQGDHLGVGGPALRVRTLRRDLSGGMVTTPPVPGVTVA